MLSKLSRALFWASLTLSSQTTAAPSASLNPSIKPYKDAPLQDLVTWDEHSIFVRGERIMLFNGEFHPYRLPVPSLWLDILQKLKAAGFSAVSFYTDWALLEGKEGQFVNDGIFSHQDFFAAASEAGIYLVARPGPYINAESSGGGFPGWLSRYKAVERTESYLPLTENYVKGISQEIAKAQITNGGPVILLQPENEYSQAVPGVKFPDRTYFQGVEDLYRDNGIVVPFVSNDAFPHGYLTPGSGNGSVDIYGYDGYPLGFDCANPYTWPDNSLPNYYLSLHRSQSPSTPNTISEFQGGSFDPWGGTGFAKCVELLGPEFERVFYKNNYAADVTIFNLYMVYGGTNWGNLGHPGGYTSYDYGSIIAEDRTITREKFSEIKLQTNFFKVSPTYLVSNATYTVNGSYVNTPLIGTARLQTNTTNLYITRHAAYNTNDSTDYKLEVPSSAGNLSIPQLSGSLTLNGRDSKIHVVDYDVGGINLLYSSAEVFTWKKYGQRTVLVLYGAPNETHEAAFVGQSKPTVVEGTGVTFGSKDYAVIANWAVTPERKVLQFPSGLYVYLLDRYDAYNYWVIDLPAASPADNYTTSTTKSIIARAGYLLRTASVSGSTLSLTGDLNQTTTVEVIGGAPVKAKLIFNGKTVNTTTSKIGTVTGTVEYSKPQLNVPSLSNSTWKYVDSLPEIQSTYDDSAWPNADHTYSNNTVYNLTTPTSLFGSDYGFNTGNLLFRGHFTATGKETTLSIGTQGGSAYASSIYLNSTLLNAYPGTSANGDYVQTATLPTLQAGAYYTLTVVIDNMGLDEDGTVGADGNKDPRGILNYTLADHSASDITWKITGNLGGEDYPDLARGPLNEGGLYAERQGYHLPNPPTQNWTTASPFQGISKPGVGFYTTSFELDVPAGFDVPMSFVFSNSTGNYRSQLYVNGYQFGKYVNNIGPQTSFPVPEGILNYHGTNYIALSLWGFDSSGNKLDGLQLQPTAEVLRGYGTVTNSPMPAYSPRTGAY